LPFWFIILYYFFPHILEVGWYEKLLFLFVPASIWYSMEVVIHAIFIPLLEERNREKLSPKEFWFIVLLDAFLYLIPLFILAYYLKMTFEWFCWIAFGFRFLCLVYALFLAILLGKKKKNKEHEELNEIAKTD